ncbi:NUDIX domain-containing protein [Neisseria animalis]|uniref:8-oxo-dGTP diphosphatase n=1 Tax=Neisseria animalis TaxID=492 RepID=A0A5P3MVA8_NEIAN|nr:NUDIX domain-containing protein [Neisseria animalis]QEY25005.1 NUDIX domain-containing protein [Neisseria animalis]ROW32229.1 NUDIX domain-containing protein [Neisseria animalis]
MNTLDTRTLVDVVAGIVMNRNGEYLLSSRPEGKPYAGYWEFAGGKVEAGESGFEALRREFAEELGIDIHRAVPWLTKIHSYEHARVHLRFLWINPDDWSGRLQAKEGQSWSWQKAGDFTVSPMLPANGPLLKALSVPRVLSGSLNSGLYGENAAGLYFVAPYATAEPHHRHILIGAEKLAALGKMPAADSVWIVLQTASQWENIQDADVAVWQVENETDAQAALTRLQQGVSLPLVIAAAPPLLEQYRQRWSEAGAHALLAHETVEAV